MMEEWKKKNHIYVSAKTVKYLVKSGRLSHTKGLIAKALNINPIISMDNEGKGTTYGKAFSEKGSLHLIMKDVKKLLKSGRLWNYSITHIDNPQMADLYIAEMEKLTGKKPLFINDCSPVLGANGGPGLVVLSVMEE